MTDDTYHIKGYNVFRRKYYYFIYFFTPDSTLRGLDDIILFLMLFIMKNVRTIHGKLLLPFSECP